MHVRVSRSVLLFSLPIRIVIQLLNIRDLRFSFCFVSFLKRFVFYTPPSQLWNIFLCAYRVSATNTTLEGPRFRRHIRGGPSRMIPVIIKFSRDLIFHNIRYFFLPLQSHVLTRIQPSAISIDEMYDVDGMWEAWRVATMNCKKKKRKIDILKSKSNVTFRRVRIPMAQSRVNASVYIYSRERNCNRSL